MKLRLSVNREHRRLFANLDKGQNHDHHHQTHNDENFSNIIKVVSNGDDEDPINSASDDADDDCDESVSQRKQQGCQELADYCQHSPLSSDRSLPS